MAKIVEQPIVDYIIAVAVSGTPDKYKIDTYVWEKGRQLLYDEKGPFVNLDIHSVLTYAEYITAFESLNTIKS